MQPVLTENGYQTRKQNKNKKTKRQKRQLINGTQEETFLLCSDSKSLVGANQTHVNYLGKKQV